MVRVSDISMKHKDLPQALILINEMNLSAQHVASLVDKMIQKVRRGELTNDQGLSFLEVKYNMLLSYLINLTYVVLRKCSGEKILQDPCIDRLVEVRTILEKIKPIDQKLKYQIDKLVKCAVANTSIDDPTLFKANPEHLIDNIKEVDAESGSDDGEVRKKEKISDVYVPPKLSASYYSGDKTSKERKKLSQEHSKKLALSTSILNDLREEYMDIPIEISQGSRAQQVLNKQQLERQQFEEEYMTRLPVSKYEKHSRHQLTTMGSLGDEITVFDRQSNQPKRGKRKFSVDKKKRGTYKKRRFH